ncbi:MAG TPA: serine--tRNA ligase, partial [Candidatus Paceibacterota bacterium]|nr:serine--tRNA ligase [Candidatus Paceibacterota bacterium]
KEAAEKKHVAIDVNDLIKTDDQRREILKEIEARRAEQNFFSQKIPQANENEKEGIFIEMRKLKEDLQKREGELKEVMKKWQSLMLQVPNIPDVSVPEGASDEDNLEIRTWGEIPKFSFSAKSHIELAEQHDLADFKRGTAVSGFRGYFLKNEGATLSFALWNFFVRHLTADGFTPMIVPSMVNKETLLGTGYLPQGEDDLYKTQDEMYLSGTAEVATMSYLADTVLEEKDLPLKFVSFSPCFRREAGSYGKDTKGLMRVHEFFKVEQVVICEASHQTSVKHHEELTANAETLMQKLGIPYRVVANCGGDLGLGQVKKYDIEAWVPSEGKYRETHSASYFHDFQTRRLNIRYRDKDGKLRFAHSLNDTAVATPRVLIPLLENHQREDGSIIIPESLREYFGKEKIG